MKPVLTLILALLAGVAHASPVPPPHAQGDLLAEIKIAAGRASLDPKLVQAVIAVESNYAENAVSPKGAEGLMQVMPATGEECGIQGPYHTMNHLMGACECLRKLINRYRGNLKLALAAYNAGTGAVARYNGVPPYRETQDYVKKVLKTYSRLKRK